jgi:large subunit ribosomal protein L14e
MTELSQFKRFVQIGRVCLINFGPYEGKLCVILDVIDANRALITGPVSGVPRQALNFKRMALTNFKVKINRGARNKVVAKAIETEKIQEQWEKTSIARKITIRNKRANLNDFDRFKVMVLKKKKNRVIREATLKLMRASRKPSHHRSERAKAFLKRCKEGKRPKSEKPEKKTQKKPTGKAAAKSETSEKKSTKKPEEKPEEKPSTETAAPEKKSAPEKKTTGKPVPEKKPAPEKKTGQEKKGTQKQPAAKPEEKPSTETVPEKKTGQKQQPQKSAPEKQPQKQPQKQPSKPAEKPAAEEKPAEKPAETPAAAEKKPAPAEKKAPQKQPPKKKQ